MPPKFKFQEGEKVLCFHGPLIYEAKCLESEVTDKEIRYYIHYAGWNKNWDEWVPESRVLKFNEANVQKQKELQKAHKANPQKRVKSVKKRTETGKETESRSSTPSSEKAALNKSFNISQESPATPSSSQELLNSDVSRKKRRRLVTSSETDEQFETKIEIKIKIPDNLLSWLIMDSEMINKKNKLFKLPAKLSVNQILDNYIKYKASNRMKNNFKESLILEITSGIKEYFNIILGTQLLYNLERSQYQEIIKSNPDSLMSQHYGSIHLLRLFVRIGEMLSYTPLDKKSVHLLTNQLQEFLSYLNENAATIFHSQDYEAAIL